MPSRSRRSSPGAVAASPTASCRDAPGQPRQPLTPEQQNREVPPAAALRLHPSAGGSGGERPRGTEPAWGGRSAAAEGPNPPQPARQGGSFSCLGVQPRAAAAAAGAGAQGSSSPAPGCSQRRRGGPGGRAKRGRACVSVVCVWPQACGRASRYSNSHGRSDAAAYSSVCVAA